MNRRGIIGFLIGPIVKWALLGIGGLFVIAWLITLVNVKTSELEVTGVGDVSLSGLTLTATLTVDNGGFLPVQIASIPYTVTLDTTNATLATGEVEGFTLSPGESRPIPLEMELLWEGAGMTAIQILTEESVPATIEARVGVQPINIFTIPITVRKEVDLANYTADRTGAGIVDAAIDTLQNSGITDRITDILN